MRDRNVGVLITWAYVVLLFAGKQAEQLPFRVMHIPAADSASYVVERAGYAREQLSGNDGQAWLARY